MCRLRRQTAHAFLCCLFRGITSDSCELFLTDPVDRILFSRGSLRENRIRTPKNSGPVARLAISFPERKETRPAKNSAQNFPDFPRHRVPIESILPRCLCHAKQVAAGVSHSPSRGQVSQRGFDFLQNRLPVRTSRAWYSLNMATSAGRLSMNSSCRVW